MGKFILSDISRVPLTGALKSKELGALNNPTGPWMGHALVATPFEAHTSIDYTGPIGAASAIYYSLIFQLTKWEYASVQKYDEWIEVSPVHQAYYQLTQRQKEELEGKIKLGLGSAAQAVADYELLLHDKRRYEEMLHYMGYESTHDKDLDEETIDFSPDDDAKKNKIREGRSDNHALKAMFIDQVDVHTGDGISMRSIVQRWPTMISDFMRMDDKDTEPDKVRVKLDISRAEAVVLVTKNKLFIEWKSLFLPDMKSRYKRIIDLVRSRKKSVSEYREWLKPVIARHKLIKEGLASEKGRSDAVISPYTTAGHPVSLHEITVWTWKDFMPPEIYKIPAEIMAAKPVKIYDEWTKRNLIFNKKYGLVVDYPWITENWVQEQLKWFKDNGWLIEHRHYYSFFEIKFIRTIIRTPQGEEIEDGTYDVNLATMSQNAMFAKLLELKAKQEDFNRYVDELIGVPHKPPEGDKPGFEDKKPNAILKALESLNIPLQFFKRGPYERDFNDRITKYYLAPIAGDRYVPIVNFIKSKIGYGQ